MSQHTARALLMLEMMRREMEDAHRPARTREQRRRDCERERRRVKEKRRKKREQKDPDQ